MPSINQGRARQSDRQRFERVKAEIGHDPARFLDVDFLDNPDAGRLAKSVIDGLGYIEAVEAWRAVERNLGRGPDGGPRQGVIERLDERREWIETHGERDELGQREIRPERRTTVIIDGEPEDCQEPTAREKVAAMRGGAD